MKIDINNNIEEDISHFSKKLVKGEKYTLTYFNIDIPDLIRNLSYLSKKMRP